MRSDEMIVATAMIQVDMTGIMQGQFELVREMLTEIIVMMIPYALGIVGLMVIVTVAKAMFMKFVSNIHPERNLEYGAHAPEMGKYGYQDGFEDIYAAREEGDWEDYEDDDITKDRSSPYYGYTYEDYLEEQPGGIGMPPEEYDWHIKNEGEYPEEEYPNEYNFGEDLGVEGTHPRNTADEDRYANEYIDDYWEGYDYESDETEWHRQRDADGYVVPYVYTGERWDYNENIDTYFDEEGHMYMTEYTDGSKSWEHEERSKYFDDDDDVAEEYQNENMEESHGEWSWPKPDEDGELYMNKDHT